MPSSRKDSSKGKRMCPLFLTQARQPRHRFSVGLKVSGTESSHTEAAKQGAKKINFTVCPLGKL